MDEAGLLRLRVIQQLRSIPPSMRCGDVYSVGEATSFSMRREPRPGAAIAFQDRYRRTPLGAQRT